MQAPRANQTVESFVLHRIYPIWPQEARLSKYNEARGRLVDREDLPPQSGQNQADRLLSTLNLLRTPLECLSHGVLCVIQLGWCNYR